MHLTLLLAILLSVPTLAPESAAPETPLRLADRAWMAGDWHGPGPDGTVMEERWTPVEGSNMLGSFRMLAEGALVFSQLGALNESATGVEMVIRAFNNDLTDADGGIPAVFGLISCEGSTATFAPLDPESTDHMTYSREGDTLTITLVQAHEGEPVVSGFVLWLREPTDATHE